jgi:putative FmdB family regulatory protein
MPLYDFECGDCGHRFERLLYIGDPNPGACPRCGCADGHTKLPSPPNFKIFGHRASQGYGNFKDDQGSFHSNRGGMADKHAELYANRKKEGQV